jgi:hypothetical protein
MTNYAGASENGIIWLKGYSMMMTSKLYLVAFDTEGTVLATNEVQNLRSLFISPDGTAIAVYDGVMIAYQL